jgi:hypothetical protein
MEFAIWAATSAKDKALLVLTFLRAKVPIAVLCKKYGINEINYYRWRNIFITAGIEALQRQPQRPKREPSKTSPKCKRVLSVESAKTDLQQRLEALRTSNAGCRAKFPDSTRSTLLNLIETAPIPKVSAVGIAGIARSTYYRWRKNAILNTPTQKPDDEAKYVRVINRKSNKEAVFRVLHSPPSDYGFNRTTGKMEDLQQALRSEDLKIGKHAIRAIIKNSGYRWLKARKVLTSRDPDYRAKLDNIQKILGGLSENKGFFSIDEYGPFSVKHRAGRRLVPPGEAPTIPQHQKSKGSLIMTAALELSRNQITHFYSPRKDTGEMIRMIAELIHGYQNKSTIYISWDAASWHISKKLNRYVTEHNTTVTNEKLLSPLIELAPLPSGAQFLNVVESVFSGMARAIIANSNYASVEEARAAIDRYFEERNEKFKRNPKRAGGKIWGMEREPARFSESNNCKDPRYR